MELSYFLNAGIIVLLCYSTNKLFPGAKIKPQRLLVEALICLQINYILFTTSVPFWASLLFPIFIIVFIFVVLYNKGLTFTQKKCLVDISHVLLWALFSAWYILNGGIPKSLYNITAGYSMSYSLYNSVIYYDPYKLNSYSFITIIHYSVVSFICTYIIGLFDDAESQAYVYTIMLYALLQSAATQLCFYYVLNEHKRNVSLFIVIIINIIITNYTLVWALIYSTSLGMKVVIIFIIIENLHWSYKTYKLLYTEKNNSDKQNIGKDITEDEFKDKMEKLLESRKN